MRKSSTILEELNENKELAKATGLAADEKDFIEGEIADLEKEYEAALVAEKNTPAPKKKEIEPVTKKSANTKKPAPVKKPAKTPKKAPKTQDDMAFIVYKGKKIYENEPEYCEKSIEVWKERKAAQKKAAGKYKTKPVIQKVASNIVSAVAKGIDTIKHDDIKDNPKEAIKKMEQLEKAGKQFLEAYKNILGEKISDKAIKEEFEGLDETIKKISEKYLAEKTKFESGGDVLSTEEKHELRVLKALSGFNNGLNRNGLFEALGLSNYRFDKYATKEQANELMETLKRLEDKGFISVDGEYDNSLTIFKHTPSGRKYLDSFSIGVYADGGEVRSAKSLTQLEEEIAKLKFTPASFRVIVKEDAWENTNDPYSLDVYEFDNLQEAHQKFQEELNNIEKMYSSEVPDYKSVELEVWDEDDYNMETLDVEQYDVNYEDDYGKLVIEYSHEGKGMNYAHKFLGLFFLDKYNEKNLSNNPHKMFSRWTSILDLTKSDFDGLNYDEAIDLIKDEANLKLQNSITLDDIKGDIDLIDYESEED